MERTDVSPLSSPAVAVLLAAFQSYLLAEGFEAEALPTPKAKVQGRAEEAAAKAAANAEKMKANKRARRKAKYRDDPAVREKQKTWRQNNVEKVKAYDARKRQKPGYREYHKAWKQNNVEKCAVYAAKRKERRRQKRAQSAIESEDLFEQSWTHESSPVS